MLSKPAETTASGESLHIGPGRIGAVTQITYSLLVDGIPPCTFQHALLDVKARRAKLLGHLISKKGLAYCSLTLGLIILMLNGPTVMMPYALHW